MYKLFMPCLLLLLLASCGGEEPCKECQLNEKEKDTVIVDDMTAAMMNDTVSTPSSDHKEVHDKIVQKYGEQWDFCKCIVANDSITDAFEKDLTPAQEEQLMKRWDYVDSKCKELTTFDNQTPEERAKHDKRVNKCLKQNGLKK
jgi:hypothetical protein